MNAARLFVLADQYDIGSLRVSTCNGLFDLSSCTSQRDAGLMPLPGVVDYIYTKTQRKAIIRMIIADWFAWVNKFLWQQDGESTDWLYTIPVFGVDLALALHEVVETPYDNPFDGTKSQYIQELQKKSEGASSAEVS